MLLTGCTHGGEGPADAALPEQSPPAVTVVQSGDASLHFVRANRCEDGAPMSLTASDGSGLALQAVAAKAVVDGPLAFTELRLAFHNPQDRQLEGRFAITLPPGAAISRFAMKLGDRWQEGEVVERQAARVAYEDFLHRKQDPALLENDGGNVFRARVFPIPARADKELIVSYSQALPHRGEPFRLPICGLPELGALDVDVMIMQPPGADTRTRTVQHLSLHDTHVTPTQDLEARVGPRGAAGLRDGELVVARIAPKVSAPPQPVDALTILFDTSASRALDLQGQVDRLGRLVQRLAAASTDGVALRVIAMDQDIETIYEGPASGFSAEHQRAIVTRGAMGATDLAGALAKARTGGLLHPRVLMVGDGVVTAGEADAAAVAIAIAGLAEAGVERFDVLVDGGIQDRDMLSTLVKAGLPSDGVLLDARMRGSEIIDKLGRATKSGVTVAVPGASWVWPRTLDGVQTGDEVLVYARVPEGTDVRVALTGATLDAPRPALVDAPGALLHRAHAQAEIESLTAELADLEPGATTRKDVVERIVTLSTTHRVLSDYTALLVLETEDDYRRFGIDRRSLTDILTVGPAGIDTVTRHVPSAPEPMEIAQEDGGDVDLSANKPGKKVDTARALEFRGQADDAEAFDGDRDAMMADEDEAGGADTRHHGEEGRMGRPTPDPTASMLVEREPAPPPAEPPGDSEPVQEAPTVSDPYEGRFGTVMGALAAGKTSDALADARAWRKAQPGDVLALVALGEAHEAAGARREAARAYGSIIDLFPSRADLRRMAGERLERLEDDGLGLGIDTYKKALEQRPDHASVYRLLAYALVRVGEVDEAFTILEQGLRHEVPGGRFAEVHRILREDLGIVGQVLVHRDPTQQKRVAAALRLHGATLATAPSLRFVLNWETDANDVDLHVYDAKGGHAWYSSKQLASGGELFADVTTGYGPECFAVNGKASAFPYRVQAHYYARGPMGYGMGKLQVVRHDGAGGVELTEMPFVIMKDRATVDLLEVKR